MIAQSMAQVAIRFSEPEGAAADSMVTVGQAIRREVAAMGDGVERAIARAGELETLVANEVAALERAYSDNEVRIRALLQDIAHQRDNLVGQAEQVRSAISGVQIDLRHDIALISDAIASRVDEVAKSITGALEERGAAHHQRPEPCRRQHDPGARRTRRRPARPPRGSQRRDHARRARRLRAADHQPQLQDRPRARRVRRSGRPRPRNAQRAHRPHHRRIRAALLDHRRRHLRPHRTGPRLAEEFLRLAAARTRIALAATSSTRSTKPATGWRPASSPPATRRATRSTSPSTRWSPR